MFDADGNLGAFGKIPALGDFFKRRLPNSFLDLWDAWLRVVMARSRGDLGVFWLDAFLTSPIWRFVLARDVCGEAAVAGVLMPSVDAVNRHFPLTLANLLPASCSPFAVAAAEAWFVQLEELGLTCLARRLDPEAIEGHLDGIEGPHIAATPLPFVPVQTADRSTRERSCWPYDPSVPGFLLECLYPAALDEFARRMIGAYSVWWTTGSDAVEPVVRIFRGLPPDREFASFLTGGCPKSPAERANLGSPVVDGANDTA
jgi:type VI secretion system protein ImpM